jgi:hypothetical protein
MSAMKSKPSGFSFILHQKPGTPKRLPGTPENPIPASPPRILMRDGRWLVPPEQRPSIKSSSPPDKPIS